MGGSVNACLFSLPGGDEAAGPAAASSRGPDGVDQAAAYWAATSRIQVTPKRSVSMPKAGAHCAGA